MSVTRKPLPVNLQIRPGKVSAGDVRTKQKNDELILVIGRR